MWYPLPFVSLSLSCCCCCCFHGWRNKTSRPNRSAVVRVRRFKVHAYAASCCRGNDGCWLFFFFFCSSDGSCPSVVAIAATASPAHQHHSICSVNSPMFLTNQNSKHTCDGQHGHKGNNSLDHGPFFFSVTSVCVCDDALLVDVVTAASFCFPFVSVRLTQLLS